MTLSALSETTSNIFSLFLTQCRERIDDHLSQQLTNHAHHHRLQEAMAYSLLNGGKRVRPTLTYASAQATGHINPSTDCAAVAVEAIHAYSLIHDDLPAMDDDNLRRGQPTCHIAFDEATAILAGDALQAFAFEVLCSAEAAPDSLLRIMMLTLAQASGAKGMVAGQSVDLEAVNTSLDLAQLETMHQLKTGALINASVRLGALSAGASDSQLDALHNYSSAIGLAFQVQDDILDVISDTQTLGKQQGADAALSKPTYVSLLGLEAAQEKAKHLYEEAMDSLSSFDQRAEHLRYMAAYIVNRQH